MGRWRFCALHVEKWRMSEQDKKNVEREVCVKVREDDILKNEEGRGKPSLSLRGEGKPQMSHYSAVSQAQASI